MFRTGSRPNFAGSAMPHCVLVSSGSERVDNKLLLDAILSETFWSRNAYDVWWGCERGVRNMATQIVMDHTGDTRHYFNADDTEALSRAEERFKSLISAGYTAAVRDRDRKAAVTRSFDPTAEETLFYPRLVGG